MLQSSSSDRSFRKDLERSSAHNLPQHDALCPMGRSSGGWAEVSRGLSHERKASHSPYLAEKPRVVLGESCPVSVWGDSGILETVLDGRGCADILVQELLPRLLRDGFG